MHNEIEYVFNLLENHRLKEALVQIHAMASQCSSWQLRTDVETLQTTYDLMLQYNAKGIKIPNKRICIIKYSDRLTKWQNGHIS